jgi:virginiamycin A acetyltransferase
MPAPNPNIRDPIPGQPRVQYLKPFITSPLIDVGEYSYYDDPGGSERFQEENVLYHYGPERLTVGRFCAFATGVRFIMNGANHRIDGVSTFPFPIFGECWGRSFDLLQGLPNRGDTVVGHDVWIGYEALIAPGISIGDGAIIATRSVVTKNVRPYAIVAGNPAVEIRRRFDDTEIEALLEIAWWNWPIEKITENIAALMTGDVATLKSISAYHPQ